jgi:phospholipid-binding lipoprotein MlaA
MFKGLSKHCRQTAKLHPVLTASLLALLVSGCTLGDAEKPVAHLSAPEVLDAVGLVSAASASPTSPTSSLASPASPAPLALIKTAAAGSISAVAAPEKIAGATGLAGAPRAADDMAGPRLLRAAYRQLAQSASSDATAPGLKDEEDLFSNYGDEVGLGYNPADIDPFELFNRFIWAINGTIDTLIYRPLAVTYRDWAPDLLRSSVKNFVNNLYEPWTLVNNLAQGDVDRAGDTIGRFLTNSALGFGFFNPAEGLGLPYTYEDFGQTMGYYGAGPGAYLILPVLGPSTVRDSVGLLVGAVGDPYNYISKNSQIYFSLGRAGLYGLNWRVENLDTQDEIARDAIDDYARFRSLYLQYRESLIRNDEAKTGEPPLFQAEDSSIQQSNASQD